MTSEMAELLEVKADITGNEMVDKILGALFGLVGFGGLVAAIVTGINKIPVVDDVFTGTQYRDANKFITFIKLVYDMGEPILRKVKPEWKEKLYWIDQIFDLVTGFLDRDDVKGLFGR